MLAFGTGGSWFFLISAHSFLSKILEGIDNRHDDSSLYVGQQKIILIIKTCTQNLGVQLMWGVPVRDLKKEYFCIIVRATLV